MGQDLLGTVDGDKRITHNTHGKDCGDRDSDNFLANEKKEIGLSELTDVVAAGVKVSI